MTLPIVHASLFTGCGGFDEAAKQIGWTNLFNCEIDDWLRAFLRQKYPQTKNYGNIHQLNALEYHGRVDVLSGGFPCQPFSSSGKMQGKQDPRYLFPAMHRIINEVQPSWVVAENVRSILTSEVASEVVARMEDSGYEVWPVVLPASSVGAWHERYRTFFLCHSLRFGLQRRERWQQCQVNENRHSETFSHANGLWQSQPKGANGPERGRNSNSSEESVLYTNGFGHQAGIPKQRPQLGHSDYPNAWQEDWPSAASRLCRMAYGVPDRANRIRALGNAVVVPLVLEIFKAIETVEIEINQPWPLSP